MLMEQRKPELIFSTLTGIVMLMYMIASLTDRELFRFEFNLGGFSLGMSVNAMELLIPLTAIVIVLGMYYTLKTNLDVPPEDIRLHLFLPFAVTLTIGFALRNLPAGLTGWGLLFLTGALLYLVLWFEYNACDPASGQSPLSIIVLDALCYAIFLLFVVTLRANVSRQIITLPAIFVLCTVICLKIYSFHLINQNIPLLSAISGIVMTYAEAGLHYWPINVVSYGALMFLWYYSFTSFVIGVDHEEPYRSIAKRVLPVGVITAALAAAASLGWF